MRKMRSTVTLRGIDYFLLVSDQEQYDLFRELADKLRAGGGKIHVEALMERDAWQYTIVGPVDEVERFADFILALGNHE